MDEKLNESLEKTLKTVSVYLRWIALLVVVALLLSGVTFVQSGEVALIFRFGKLVGDVPSEQIHESGLCFAFPYMIDKVVRVPVKEIKQMEIDGLFTDGSIKDITKTGYALTGDKNIVLANAVLKYKIKDPIQYTITINSPEKMLKEIVTSALTQQIASMQVNGVLTEQKKELVSKVLEQAQGDADNIGLGVQLVALEFSKLQPPNEVKASFDLVTSTYVENETLLQKAKSYHEKTISQATAQRNAMIQRENSNKAATIAGAKSDVAQFNGVIDEYNKNPEIVKERLYREKVETIMEKVARKIIVSEDENGTNIVMP